MNDRQMHIMPALAPKGCRPDGAPGLRSLRTRTALDIPRVGANLRQAPAGARGNHHCPHYLAVASRVIERTTKDWELSVGTLKNNLGEIK